MKNLLLILGVLFSLTSFSQINTWTTSTSQYMQGAVNPSSTAVNAAQGATFFDTSNGNIYLKKDQGFTTNWSCITCGGSTPLTTKGDVFGFSTVNARIPIGSDTQVLTADSSQTLGLKWAAAGTASPLTTKGDLYGFSTVNARLPVGSNTQVLTADSTQPLGVKWAAGGGGSSQWTTTGSDIYYTTGNVGIGTATPAHFLDVANTSSPAADIILHKDSGIWNAGTVDDVTRNMTGFNQVVNPTFTVTDSAGEDLAGTVNTYGTNTSMSLAGITMGDNLSEDFSPTANIYGHNLSMTGNFTENEPTDTDLGDTFVLTGYNFNLVTTPTITADNGDAFQFYGANYNMAITKTVGDTNVTGVNVHIANSLAGAGGSLVEGLGLSVTSTGSVNRGIGIDALSGGTQNIGIYVGGPSAATGNYALGISSSAVSYFNGNVGFGSPLSDAIAPVDITGNLRMSGHVVLSQSSAPTAAVQSAAGTGASCAMSHSTDTAGIITLTTTAVSPGTGAQCIVTFHTAFGTAPICVATPASAVSVANLVLSSEYVTSTTTTMTVNFGSTDAAGHTYVLNYHCVQTN